MASIEEPQTPPNHRSRVAGDENTAESIEEQKSDIGSPEEHDDHDHDEDEEADEHKELPHDNRYNKVKLPSKHPLHTPAVNKRRQASKHIVVQSPTDNIFSPISQKLLGRKRNDPSRLLPDPPSMSISQLGLIQSTT